MSSLDIATEIFDAVQVSFQDAIERPDIARWKSCSVFAGAASVRLAADGQLFRAAAMEGVAEEAKRQALAMMPQREKESA